MKRIFALVLALCLLAGLVSCSGKGFRKKGQNGTPSEGLSFELNEAGDGYVVTGIGICNDTDLVIPSAYRGKLVTTIGEEAFIGCTALSSIAIPNSVTTIGEAAFSGCDCLTSITIPNSVTTIGEEAFASCDGLTSITIGNSVTTIGGFAFSNCAGLTSITIPDSVTTIDESAFRCCRNLKTVNYKGSAAQWSKIRIGSANDSLTDANIVYDYQG